MSLARQALRISFGLCWTVCAFLGGYFVAKDPLPQVLVVTAFVAFITGLVHVICAMLAKRRSRLL